MPLDRRSELRSGAFAPAAPAGLIASPAGAVPAAPPDALTAFEPVGEPLECTADHYFFAPFHLGNRDPHHLDRRRRQPSPEPL